MFQIPVYLSKVLADKLFIFQYPLKSNSDCFHNSTFRKVLIKPQNQKVRLEVKIDHSKDNVNYDHQRGKHLATYIDGVTDRFESGKDDSYFSRYTFFLRNSFFILRTIELLLLLITRI